MDAGSRDIEVLEHCHQSDQGSLIELQELQLALVGGGIGDTVR